MDDIKEVLSTVAGPSIGKDDALAKMKQNIYETTPEGQLEKMKIEIQKAAPPLTREDLVNTPNPMTDRLNVFDTQMKSNLELSKDYLGIESDDPLERMKAEIRRTTPDPEWKSQDALGAVETFAQGASQATVAMADTARGKNELPMDIPFSDRDIDLNTFNPNRYVSYFGDMMGDKILSTANKLGINDKKLTMAELNAPVDNYFSAVKGLAPTKFEIDHPKTGEFVKEAGKFLPEMMFSQSQAAKTIGASVTKTLLGKYPHAIKGAATFGRAIEGGVGALIGGVLKGDVDEALENTLRFPLYELGLKTSFKLGTATVKAPFKATRWGVNKISGGKFDKWMAEQRHSMQFIDDLMEHNIDMMHDKASAKTKMIGKATNYKEWLTYMKKKGINVDKIPEQVKQNVNMYFENTERTLVSLKGDHPTTGTGTLRKLMNNLEKRYATLEDKGIREWLEPQIKMRNQLLEDIEQGYLLDEMHKVGIQEGAFKSMNKFSRIFYNTIERVSRVDEHVAIGATESVMDLIHGNNVRQNTRKAINMSFEKPMNALKKMKIFSGNKAKYDGSDITNSMKYVEMGKDGKPFWNPTASIENGYPKFNGVTPSDDALEHLFKIRNILDDIYQSHPDLFKDVGYVPRYIPRQPKYSIPKIGGKIHDPLALLERPRIANSRTLEEAMMSKGVEDDFGKLMDNYSNQVSNYDGFKTVIPKLQKTLMRMRALGLDDEATNLGDSAAKAMGFKEVADMRRISASSFAQANNEQVEIMLKNMGMKPNIVEDVFRTVNKLMYESFIGMNPKTILYKQPNQPLWVGAGETGTEYVFKAQAALASGRYRGLLKQMSPYLRAEELDLLETGMAEASRKSIKYAGDALGFVGKGGLKGFTMIDKINRQTSFLSGYMKMGDAIKTGGTNYKNMSPELLETIEHLLPGEKIMVVKALQQKGSEAGKRMFGTIISNRVNYDYGLINKPQWLRSQYGRYIPFTTWGRNQFMRVVGDIKNKNVKQLSKRVALPLAYAMIVKMLTGYDTTDTMPVMSMGATLPGTITPQVQQSLRKLQTQGAGAASLDIFKAVPTSKAVLEIKRTAKIGRKKGKLGAVMGGFFHAQEDGWITSLGKALGLVDK